MRVRVYGLLRDAIGGAMVSVPVDPGETVGSLVGKLLQRYPALRGKLLDRQGAPLPFVMFSVNGRDVRDGRGLDEPLTTADELLIFPPSAGG